MPDIKEQKLLYHLTSIENLSSIFQNGLRSRAHLDAFADVADTEILRKRQALELERYVPFHWFAANPFDENRPLQVLFPFDLRPQAAPVDHCRMDCRGAFAGPVFGDPVHACRPTAIC